MIMSPFQGSASFATVFTTIVSPLAGFASIYSDV
jgi:hypothetical protein